MPAKIFVGSRRLRPHDGGAPSRAARFYTRGRGRLRAFESLIPMATRHMLLPYQTKCSYVQPLRCGRCDPHKCWTCLCVCPALLLCVALRCGSEQIWLSDGSTEDLGKWSKVLDLPVSARLISGALASSPNSCRRIYCLCTRIIRRGKCASYFQIAVAFKCVLSRRFGAHVPK